MKLSKKTEYGLRFLLALSELNEGRYMGIYQISLRHNIPLKFLEAIAVSLKKEGFLDVKKGAGGGYCLKRKADEITLLMVYNCLEDKFKTSIEIHDEDSNNQKAVYATMNKLMADVVVRLDSFTLADIQKEFRSLNENLMYYI